MASWEENATEVRIEEENPGSFREVHSPSNCDVSTGDITSFSDTFSDTCVDESFDRSFSDDNFVNYEDPCSEFQSLQSTSSAAKSNEQVVLEGLAAVTSSYPSVSKSYVNSILKVIKEHPAFSAFPSDYRSLLKTPRSYSLRQVEPGSYYHFGVESSIVHCLSDVNIMRL